MEGLRRGPKKVLMFVICYYLWTLLQKVNTRVDVDVVTVKMTSDVQRWKISREFCLAILVTKLSIHSAISSVCAIFVVCGINTLI